MTSLPLVGLFPCPQCLPWILTPFAAPFGCGFAALGLCVLCVLRGKLASLFTVTSRSKIHVDPRSFFFELPQSLVFAAPRS
jgi:hypothetical protein